MKTAFVMFALTLLLPAPAMADGVLARQLHYVGSTRIEGRLVPMTIDLDIGAISRYGTSRVFIDEHVGEQDLGEADIVLDRTGIVPGYYAQLTFEEETLLDMLSLEFENMTGVGVGDTWERAGELQSGTHETRYVVRGCSGSNVDVEVDRTIRYQDGTRGTWRGNMTYNSETVVPTSILIAGVQLNGPDSRRLIALQARLTGDSFQP